MNLQLHGCVQEHSAGSAQMRVQARSTQIVFMQAQMQLVRRASQQGDSSRSSHQRAVCLNGVITLEPTVKVD